MRQGVSQHGRHMQIHEDLKREHEIAASSERSLGFVFAGFFAIVAGMRARNAHSDAAWWLASASVFVLLALLWTRPLAPLNWLWFRIGLVLNAVISPLVMGFLFLVAIVPTGLLLRLAGKDPLRLRPDPTASTYWLDRDEASRATGQMTDQF